MTYYTVYKTVNLLNGKFYFGVHKTKNPDDEYLGSGTYVKRAVAKHGEQNLRKEVLFIYLDAESAFSKEDELVQCWRSDPLCKNLRKGGSGGFDYINREGLNGTVKAQTPEAIEKRKSTISTLLENPVYLKGLQERIRRAGRMVPPEKREANRQSAVAAMAKKWAKGDGVEHIRRRMSEAHRGEKNSGFNTCWLHKETKQVKVKRGDVNNYLLDGWLIGRVPSKPEPMKNQTLADKAPEGMKWCSGHSQYLVSNEFHKGQKLCIECRKKRRKIIPPSG
jgi:hypothetical protein